MFNELKKDILLKQEEFKKEIENVCDLNLIEDIRIKYESKKGILQSYFTKMKEIDNSLKKDFGLLINEFKELVASSLKLKKRELETIKLKEDLKKNKIDTTLPGYSFNLGTIHPLTKVINDIKSTFVKLGYSVAFGPEIESDLNCFERLNLPKGHPARDMQDTFYISPDTLLRSHTSPVQVREMLKEKGNPIAIICPGKTYRRDQDATHSHQFMQCEGLVLGENITMTDLKGTLLMLVRSILGKDRNIRLRPSYFPFTEPSVEVDVNCAKCGGKGCSMCKNTGYIEVLGAGMVHYNVLKMCGYDPSKITGFAFGVGIERMAMLKYGIEDIRNFYNNDVSFLKQFKEL